MLSSTRAFSTAMLLAVVATMPTCRAFLSPTLSMTPRCQPVTSTDAHRAQCSAPRRYSYSSGTLLRMYASEEGAATSTEPAVGGEEEAAEGQPVQASAPKPKVPAGPMMQPEEDKRRAKEEKELSEKPKGNPWASNVFKRGVVLQALVLSFIVYLQFQPKEVQNLGICPPFVDKGCVSFTDWLLIVFTGAPIPPLY